MFLLANLSETLEALLTEADHDILHSQSPSPELMSDIEEARFEIENLFANWDAPADGIAYAIEELDENFHFAGEEFLKVCDLLEEALIVRDPRGIDEAARTLRKARLLLRAAELEATERFQNWISRSKGAKH